ncbi:hypothetical protein O0I10_000375 [Lichtheimia ornata]|uniref:Uncharacterized protein n=1 Tax=Lichtheimia ornata TaxID=688661 RepID=A0AAD8DJY7_9FUNG|nr:uncharacterized protein O0I10_000375 [Lichtheimia ornata]KAJ8664097.1 hypothetical protein O0I10_000375 [Lichtheimia ornata]
MEYFYKKASSLLPGSLYHEAEEPTHGDIQQSSSAAEQQPMASTQRATVDQNSTFVAPEPTRAKQSGLLSKDNNQFGSVTGKQPVKEPSKPMPTTTTTGQQQQQQQQPGSGMVSKTNETGPNQGMAAGGGGVPDHEDEFYGSAIEQRKAPMSNAAPTSNVTQQQQPQTSDTAPTATGTHSRKDSRVISDMPPSPHQQAAGQSETAAIPPSSSQQQQQPCQKVQFSTDAPQQKQSSSQPPPLNTKAQPTAAPVAAAATTTANTNKSDGSYAADQGSFHPADSEHPAGKESAPVTDNAVPPTQQQQQSLPGDKRRGSKGSGHGIKSFFEKITHPGHSGGKGERKSSANTQQKDFSKYDISSAQKQGGFAAGPIPANGGLAAAGVGGAAMVTGIEAMEQEKERQHQQQPSTQPTTKGNGRDLGKSGAAGDIQQQQHVPPESTNEGNGMKQPNATGAGNSTNATALNQQERTNLDHKGGNIQSSTTTDDMQRTNQSAGMNNAMQQQQQQPTTADATNRHEPNQVTGNNNNTVGRNVAPMQQQQPSAAALGPQKMNQPAAGAPQQQQPQMPTTTAKEKNAATTEASQQQMQQPMSAGDGGTGGDTMTTTAPSTDQKNPATAGQGGAKEERQQSMTQEAAAIQQSSGQEVPVSSRENGGETKKWVSSPPSNTGKGIGGAIAGAAGATAVGAGVAHARGDTSNYSHPQQQQQQQQHGPSSSGDTAAQNDVAGQQQQDQSPPPPPQRRRSSLQEYISGMIDTRRGSFKETLGKLLHRENWENDGQALRMHGQQKIDDFHAAQQAHKKSITAI